MARIDHAREVREVVLRHFAAAADPNVVITRSMPIDELDLDSLDVLDITSRIQDELAVDLPYQTLMNRATVGEVIDALDDWLFGDRSTAPEGPPKPRLPQPIRLDGAGPSAAEYVNDGRT